MANVVMDDRQPRRADDRNEYRIYMALLIPLAFLAVIAGRLWPGAGKRPHSSVFRETLHYANSAVPWVFSGR